MAGKSLNDEEMLQSDENFESAYRSYSESIYKFMFWRTNDPKLSEDLTSETFRKAWTSRTSFKKGSVQAWLYRIARNSLIDHWRKTKDLPMENEHLVLDDVSDTPDEIVDKQLQVERLNIALRKLPKEMNRVIKLRFIEGVSTKQAAAKLNTSEGNIRIIQYRALKKLRGYLDE